MTANDSKSDLFTLKVVFDIKRGWHIYDDVGDGVETATSVKLDLPAGVKAVSKWRRPISEEYGSDASSLVFRNQVSFSRRVVVEPDARGKVIKVTIGYQACNETTCQRPKKEVLSVKVPGSSSSARELFENPVPLMVGDKPLNAVAGNRLVSPAIFDIDGDGQDELVTGCLRGTIDVYENKNQTAKGDPIWAARERLHAGSEDAASDDSNALVRSHNW